MEKDLLALASDLFERCTAERMSSRSTTGAAHHTPFHDVLRDAARSTLYLPEVPHFRPPRPEDLALISAPDLVRDPLGVSVLRSRRQRTSSRPRGSPVNRKRVQRLVRQMGLRALYPKPRIRAARGRTHGVSVPAEGPVHRATESGVGDRYLLHPDGAGVHVVWWHMDWYSRRVLAWRVSNTFDSDLMCRGPRGRRSPATGRRRSSIRDLQSQTRFTSTAITGPVLKAHAVAIRHGRQGPLGRQRVRRSGSGAASNTRMCISMRYEHTAAALRAGLPLIFSSTTGDVRHSSLDDGGRQMWCHFRRNRPRHHCGLKHDGDFT